MSMVSWPPLRAECLLGLLSVHVLLVVICQQSLTSETWPWLAFLVVQDIYSSPSLAFSVVPMVLPR